MGKRKERKVASMISSTGSSYRIVPRYGEVRKANRESDSEAPQLNHRTKEKGQRTHTGFIFPHRFRLHVLTSWIEKAKFQQFRSRHRCMLLRNRVDWNEKMVGLVVGRTWRVCYVSGHEFPVN